MRRRYGLAVVVDCEIRHDDAASHLACGNLTDGWRLRELAWPRTVGHIPLFVRIQAHHRDIHLAVAGRIHRTRRSVGRWWRALGKRRSAYTIRQRRSRRGSPG